MKYNKWIGSVIISLVFLIIGGGVVIAVWNYQSVHAAKPQTTVYTITITDQHFEPSQMHGTVGTAIKIHVKNIGKKEHNFVIPDYYIFSPNLHPGESTDVEFTPDKKGAFSFYSDAPGAKELGLHGTLTIAP